MNRIKPSATSRFRGFSNAPKFKMTRMLQEETFGLPGCMHQEFLGNEKKLDNFHIYIIYIYIIYIYIRN